jgi:hypothetical protein
VVGRGAIQRVSLREPRLLAVLERDLGHGISAFDRMLWIVPAPVRSPALAKIVSSAEDRVTGPSA